MTQLERQQRGLLNLIKNRGLPPNDPYLRQVADSRGLTIVREMLSGGGRFKSKINVTSPRDC